LLDAFTSAVSRAVATGDAFDIETARVAMKTLGNGLKTGDSVQINFLKPWSLVKELGAVTTRIIIY
jgi:hypothetical protein